MLNPIFEASYIQQNKSTLNRTLQYIKEYCNKNTKNWPNQYTLVFNEDLCLLKARLEIYINLRDAFLHEESDKVYILCKCEYTPIKLRLNGAPSTIVLSQDHMSNSEIEEQILSLLQRSLTREFRSYDPNAVVYSSVITKLADEGIKSNMLNGNDKDPSDYSILKQSKLFTRMYDTLTDIMSMKFNTELVKKAVPKLKLRKGVVPLMWLSKEDGYMDYPYSLKEYGSGIMATKYRTKCVLSNITRDDCKRAVKYTPYSEWLFYDEDELNKISNIDVAQTNSYNR